MLEGAVAYYQATGKDRWLNAAVRALRQMMSVIGPGKKHWVLGHQELELALMKLYRLTGDAEYLSYAKWLVTERGHGHLHAPSFNRYHFREDYCQDDLPAEQLSSVTGHAVRAMYYYTGIADIAAATKNQALAAALERLWHNVVPANLYITGGIGQDASNEGFTRDWHLPNLTAYCETCAAIGMALWNHRMNLMTGDAKYADLVETELYNGILSGISPDGFHFFYENPLASVGKHHRSEWFDCSCCPTNLVRFIPSVGGYAYATDGDTIYINQYIASLAKIELDGGTVGLRVRTEYPWSGRISIDAPETKEPVTLKLRVPAWCDTFTLSLDKEALDVSPSRGYIDTVLPGGGQLLLELDMSVRRVYADARVKEDRKRVAFARGPVVYCAEETDQDYDGATEYFHADFAVKRDVPVRDEFIPDTLGGIVEVFAGDATLVPYYAWDNRQRGGMAVWIKETD